MALRRASFSQPFQLKRAGLHPMLFRSPHAAHQRLSRAQVGDGLRLIGEAGAVMQESDLNRRQTLRLGPEVAFAQIGIIGFDGQIEVEALRLYGLPEDAPAILSGCPALPAGGRTLMFSASWDLPSMPPGATSNADVTVPGARRGDFADASLDTSSIAFVLDCHVWSNDKVRVTARNVSLSTVDLPAAGLHVQVVKRRVG